MVGTQQPQPVDNRNTSSNNTHHHSYTQYPRTYQAYPSPYYPPQFTSPSQYGYSNGYYRTTYNPSYAPKHQNVVYYPKRKPTKYYNNTQSPSHSNNKALSTSEGTDTNTETYTDTNTNKPPNEQLPRILFSGTSMSRF